MSDALVAALEWLLITVLVVFSGLFSGLNLGLMSLDTFGLEIVLSSDNEGHIAAAKKIKPLRTRGNWLLCTLLLGNVGVNSALAILLADKTDGTAGFLISTALIVMFGEIIPQAICSRYPLEVGSKTIWIVWPIMFLLAPIAYPIAFVLDKILGEELGTIYSKRELTKVVDYTAKYRPQSMDDDTAAMLKGALLLSRRNVRDVYTEMKNVYWLNENEILSFDVLTKIFKLGHSRIPVFRYEENGNVPYCIGLLYVKDLILVDPDDNIPITKILETFDHHHSPIDVWKSDNLQTTLKLFIDTCQHLAFVKENVIREMDAEVEEAGNEDVEFQYVGIITLEDVIEEILKQEVVDEYDETHKINWDNSILNQNNNKKSFNKQKTPVPYMAPIQQQQQHQEFVPVMVKILNENKKTFIGSPYMMAQPFMSKGIEQSLSSFKSLKLNKEKEISVNEDGQPDDFGDDISFVPQTVDESKSDDMFNIDYDAEQQPNDKLKIPHSTARIRSIPEIKSYLEHFIPKLSFTTTILCLFIKPLFISVNIFFIVYLFYAEILANQLMISLNFEGTFLRKQAIKVMIVVEFVGLMILFLCAIISFFKHNYAITVDCIRWTGSWSIFQLFYTFQPLILIQYLSKTLHNYYDTQILSNKDKLNKWKSLRSGLTFEIKQNQNGKNNKNLKHMKECLDHLDYLINLHESDEFDLNDIDIKELNDFSLNTPNSPLAPSFDRYRNNASYYSLFQQSNDLSPNTKKSNNFAVFYNAIFDGSSWLIFIVFLIICFCVGIFFLILKLSLFSFIVTLPLNEWHWYYHWLPFVLFMNQIWNMIDVDSIKLSTIYRFLFIDSSVQCSKYVSQRVSMLDNVIKEQLWNSFDYRGFLLALSLNDEIVQQIIVNKSYDLTTMELIKYKKLISDNHGGNKKEELRVTNIFKNRANWFEMKYEIQPYHPYVLIRENMDRYYNKLDAMNKKILISVTHLKDMDNYHEYKLAVKTFGKDGENALEKALCDDGDIVSLSKTLPSIRKFLQFRNQQKRQKNKFLLEKSKTLTLDTVTSTHSFYEINENKVLNEMVLFEWILTHSPKVTRIITILLLLFGFIITAMSIIIYMPDEYGQNTIFYPQCSAAGNINYVQIISIFDIIFIVFCVICLIVAVILKRYKIKKLKYIKKCSILLWLVLTVICCFRFGYFFPLSYECKSFIIHTKTIFFISVLSAGYFAVFMCFVILKLVLNWISNYLFMIFMFIIHLALIFMFYAFGWNFVIHLITQTLASWSHDITQNDKFSNYCQTRFIFFIIMFLMITIYLLIGLVEFFLLIRSDQHFNNNSNTKKANKIRKRYIQIRNGRKLFIALFYFTAILYAILQDVINEASGSDSDVHQECAEIDFFVVKTPIFYNDNMENMFVFIMLLDVILFGVLFKSYKIVLDPFYWFAKLVWTHTSHLWLAIISLTLTSFIFGIFGFLYVKYDIGLF